MYQEDFLLRQIKQLVAGLAKIAEDDPAAEHASIDDLLRSSLGMSIALIDRLPASAILQVLAKGDANDAHRIEALALLLEQLADALLPDDPVALHRRAKAQELRAALQP